MGITGIEILASIGKNLRKPDTTKKGDAASDLSKEDDASKEAEGADIGDALRSAYEKAVSEDIPEEMLDLLGKLN